MAELVAPPSAHEVEASLAGHRGEERGAAVGGAGELGGFFGGEERGVRTILWSGGSGDRKAAEVGRAV